MGQVTVIVNGRSYRLACGDGEEQRLIDLAEHVRQRIDDLSYEFGHAGDDRLLLMVTLMLTDELWEAKARLTALEAQVSGGVIDSEVEPAPTPQAAAPAISKPAPPAATATSEPAAAAVPAPPSNPEPATGKSAFVQEPSLQRALRRTPPQAKTSLDDRLAEARDPPPAPRKTGAS